jgi:hypothetical protein
MHWIMVMLVGGIFCDLKWAFDCVNHDALLSKLEFYGVFGKASALIKSYLSDRYQRVVVNKEHLYSDWGKIKNGVPPRSILGPTKLAAAILNNCYNEKRR